jgi:hypothetical protein
LSTTEQGAIPGSAELISAASLLESKAAGSDSSTSYPSPPTAQVGGVMIREGVLLPDGFLLDSDRYTVGWRAVRTINAFGVDLKVRSAGWNMFTIAGEFKTTVWGSTTSGLRRALIRVLALIRVRRFNSAEVTAISTGHFLGIPYTSVRVQARHIQRSYLLDGERARAQAQQDVDWARG